MSKSLLFIDVEADAVVDEALAELEVLEATGALGAEFGEFAGPTDHEVAESTLLIERVLAAA